MEIDIELISKQSSFDDFKIMKVDDLPDKAIIDSYIAKKDNKLYEIRVYKIPNPSAYDPNPINAAEDAIQSSKMSGFSKIYGAKMDKPNGRVSLIFDYPTLYGTRLTFRDIALSQLDNKYDLMKKMVSYLNSAIKTWTIYPKNMRWIDLYAGESKESPVVIEQTQLIKSKNAYMQLYVLNLMALGFFDFKVDERYYLKYYVDAVCDKNGNPVKAPENAPLACKEYMEKMNVARIFEFFKEVEQFIDFDKVDIIRLSDGIMEFKCFNESEIKATADKYGYKVDDDNMSINSIIYTAFILRDAKRRNILSDEDRQKVYNAVFDGHAFGAALLAQCSGVANTELTAGDCHGHEQLNIAHAKLTEGDCQSKIAHDQPKVAYSIKRKRFNNPSVDDF